MSINSSSLVTNTLPMPMLACKPKKRIRLNGIMNLGEVRTPIRCSSEYSFLSLIPTCSFSQSTLQCKSSMFVFAAIFQTDDGILHQLHHVKLKLSFPIRYTRNAKSPATKVTGLIVWQMVPLLLCCSLASSRKLNIILVLLLPLDSCEKTMCNLSIRLTPFVISGIHI